MARSASAVLLASSTSCSFPPNSLAVRSELDSLLLVSASLQGAGQGNHGHCGEDRGGRKGGGRGGEGRILTIYQLPCYVR